MYDEGRFQQAARFLFEEHRARHPFGPLPEALAPRTADEAYAIQAAFHTLLAEKHGSVAGYKIAMVTPVMKRLVGFDEPATGAILAKRIYQSPTTIRWADYVHLGVECEIAVKMGAGLPAASAPYSRDDVTSAVSAVMPAFEVGDDRHADYTKLAAQILTTIADNSMNEGAILGPPLTDWSEIDLASVRVEMFINGEPAGDGYGRDVMGHPLEAVVWLANMLARRGQRLEQGMVIMTGSIVATKFLNAGDTARLRVESLGEANLRVV